MEVGRSSRYLPPRWRTDRLEIADGEPADVARLTAIFNACAHVGPWDPTFQVVPESELLDLIERSQVPSGEHGNYRLQRISVQGDVEIIGYFHVYHGIPRDAGAVWVSMLVLDPAVQRHGYGREAMSRLFAELQRLGYPRVQLRVYMRNWPAMRFWVGLGFTTVVGFDGDAEYGPTTQASLVLCKQLAR